ncbi:MAG: hypothetical protein JRL30_06260 [Deltaproteobacteria bacterium]|nr:hypothetical protein [Deltaproteobacteria bacterium]
MTVLTMREASKACGILFGPQVEASLDFLKYLQPSGLKAAYRRKALETHPDRADAIGKDQAEMTQLGSKVDLNRRRAKATQRNGRQTRASDHFYNGAIPKRNLLIGQFLYYSGRVSWKTLIDAIVWQRRQRPLIGQIALRWRKLSEHEIQTILLVRKLGEKFGECAARTGYLTRFEVMALLGGQSRLQSPIGEYFLKRNILRKEDMANMVNRQQIHNRRISCQSRL